MKSTASKLSSKMSGMKSPVAYKAPSKTSIGHVHLTVSDIKKSLDFYQNLLGFEIVQNLSGEAVFLSAGGYHHHLGLNTWSADVPQRPVERQIGLYHFAILYPTRKALAQVVKNLSQTRYPLSGFTDHGVSESVYIRDPDGNGIELYYDKPKKDWPKDKNGKIKMFTKVLDVKDLLKEVE